MSQRAGSIPLPEPSDQASDEEGFFTGIFNSIGEASDKLFSGVWSEESSLYYTDGEGKRLVDLDADSSDGSYQDADESGESEWPLDDEPLPDVNETTKSLRRQRDVSNPTSQIMRQNNEALRERGRKLNNLERTGEEMGARASKAREQATAIRREAERRASVGEASSFCWFF